MGKKKPFINKKTAVTYNLIYSATEDVEDTPERLLVDASKGVGIGRPDAEVAAQARQESGRRYPPGHPLAWLEDDNGPLAEDRRKENIEYGFADDGYDYLKHLRTMNAGKTRLEGGPESSTRPPEDVFKGPSVFIPAPVLRPPSPDVLAFDATRLPPLHQATQHEEEAAKLMTGVSAFTRQQTRMRRADQDDVDELEAFMRKFEEMSEVGDEVGDEGYGDLLDDFVVAAAEAAEEEPAASSEVPSGFPTPAGRVRFDSEDEDEEFSSNIDSEDDRFDDAEEDEDEVGPSMAGSRVRGGPGSIASTYWRPERNDRNDNLSMIDERFEQLALEYDDEEIGDLEDEADTIGGLCSVDQFSHIMDQFMEQHQGSACREASVNLLRNAVENIQFADEDAKEAAMAVRKARELLEMAEREGGGRGGGEVDVLDVMGEEDIRDRWDCESVLSLRSNLDNHPGQIREPRRPRQANGENGGVKSVVRLSEKTGIPIGYSGPIGRGAQGGEPRTTVDPPASTCSTDSAPSRRKGESSDEKKQRKAAVKDAKREARVAKKSLKQAFKGETAKQQKLSAAALPSGIPLP